MDQVKESDWKLFRKRAPKRQERYINRLCTEYAALLAGEGLTSEKFGELEKRIRQDRHSPVMRIDRRRSVRCGLIL